jgi:hypothetical protein
MNVLKTKSDTSNGQPGDWTVETQPWLRRRRESRVAYAAAQVYFELPGKRSIEEASSRRATVSREATTPVTSALT